mmetsp:Transcript_59788/g.142315  ORF Transcript_59788/g.142315 Transcript_59788/m.142315 type:complete len:567 (-) Transcript_59788:177-1877(-)
MRWLLGWSVVATGCYDLATASGSSSLQPANKSSQEAINDAKAKRPNLLLLFPDQWRSDWDGLTQPGGQELPLRMPTVKKLAGQGVRFTQAYVPAPLCAPSRAALAAGREYDRTTVNTNGKDFATKEMPTIYGLLRDAGYHTIVAGKDDLTKGSFMGYKERYPGCSYCKDGDGLYLQEELGFSDGLRAGGKYDVVQFKVSGNEPHEMFGYWLRNQTVVSKDGVKQTAWDAHRKCFQTHRELPPGTVCDSNTYSSELYEDDWTAANAIALLRRRPQDKPFFMQVNFPGPHDPFLVTADMHASVSDGRVWPEATDNAQQYIPGGRCKDTGDPSFDHTRCNYAAELENLDKLFQVILDEVEKQGEMSRTIVIVSSDHGEMLGDHSQGAKSKPWQAAVSVPLIIVGAEKVGPTIPAGKSVHSPVATLDLGGTLLDFAGVEPAKGMTTVSLRPLIEGTANNSAGYRPFVSSGLSTFRVVIQEIEGVSYKYICCLGECPGKPTTAPPVAPSGWMEMLIDVKADPFDMHDLSKRHRKVVKSMRKLLPTHGYNNNNYAKGCATIDEEHDEIQLII